MRVSFDSKPPLSDPSTDPGGPVPGPRKINTALLDPPVESTPAPTPEGLQLWLHRSSVFLFVLISAIAGVLLIVLPWTPEWTDNYLLLTYPSLRTLVSSGFFRGVCTGLGLLDIWIGFWEALHYHEHN
jgi:hypothetical protein